MAAQTVVAAAYILLVLFPTLGRDYQAAVLLALSSTLTAIAFMSAITRHYGPAPNASIPSSFLVSAFFIDLVNMDMDLFSATLTLNADHLGMGAAVLVLGGRQRQAGSCCMRFT